MDVFGIKLEASIKLFAYSDNKEELFYREIDSLSSNNERIRFSALIDVKQSAEAEGKEIEVSLVHIHDDGEKDAKAPCGRSKQNVSRLHIGEIALSNFDNQIGKPFRPKLTLLKDPWEIKQLIRWSFDGVPINGPGTYAMTLAVITGDKKPERKLLDCDYVEVT